MSRHADIESRLADALRVLLPFAVADEPEWAPEEALASRRMAYGMAALALGDYDAAHEAEIEPAPLTHLLPGIPSDTSSLALVA